MNDEDIINLIIKKKLPLPDDILSRVRDFCCNNNPNFKVLGKKIPDILSKDWLDSSLDPFVSACRHTNVKPEEWRVAMEAECKRTVKTFVQGKLKRKDKSSVAALLIWRGALAYASSLAEFDIPIHHMQAKRDEETLEISTPMPLSKADENALREYDRIIIPDPMIASGMSNAFTISLLNDIGIPNEKIRLLCVVAAPEGVFHLLKRYPGIKIITATLDSKLNEHAYIIGPGLGDAGDKYFWQNSISNFNRDRFNDEQWERLKNLLKVANE